MKLRSKILVYTLPLILLPLILLALANYYFIFRADQMHAKEARERAVSEVVADIQQEMEKARKDAKLLSNIPTVLKFLSSSKPDVTSEKLSGTSARDTLRFFFEQNPYYLELVLVDALGNEQIKFSRLDENINLSNIGEREYFKSSLVSFSLDHFQTPVQLLDGIKYATVFSSNVSNESFRGMIILKLNLEILKRKLRPLAAPETSVVMFDDRGVVFANIQNASSAPGTPKMERLSFIANLLVSEDSFIDRSREFTTEIDSASFLVQPAYFIPKETMHQPKAGGKWFVGVLRTDPAGSLLGNFPILFLSVLALAATALFFVTKKIAERITIPIEKVNNATALVGRGSYDLDLEVKTGDEIEDLAKALKELNGDLLEYQKQLVQSAKLATIGEMASEVSHEIQNRISGLSLWLQCLDSDSVSEDQRKQYVDEMKQGLGGFMTMLATLKQYYQTPVLSLKKVNLNEVVSESLPFIEEELIEKGLTLKKSLDQKIGATAIDQEKIKSVVLNFLLNAIDAVEFGGLIEIKTGIDPKNGSVFISVKDDGCGISEEDLSRVFYPFYSTKDGGSGLGLAVCSNIISAHGGEIKVASEIGKGTEFTVILNTSET